MHRVWTHTPTVSRKSRTLSRSCWQRLMFTTNWKQLQGQYILTQGCAGGYENGYKVNIIDIAFSTRNTDESLFSDEISCLKNFSEPTPCSLSHFCYPSLFPHFPHFFPRFFPRFFPQIFTIKERSSINLLLYWERWSLVHILCRQGDYIF